MTGKEKNTTVAIPSDLVKEYRVVVSDIPLSTFFRLVLKNLLRQNMNLQHVMQIFMFGDLSNA